MAILRGGVRIGNFDLRIGIPRDRSLDNVNADERLRRKPGGNSETTINRFIAQVNQGEGLARPTRFLCIFQPPNWQAREEVESQVDSYSSLNDGPNELEGSVLKRNVGMMCNSVSLPSRDIDTVNHRMYGPGRAMPQKYKFPGTMECRFYGDKFLRQRAFFENWQKKVFNINTHNMEYYDDYVGTMDIYQLGQFAAEGDRDRITYAVRLYEVFPQTIGTIDYSYGAGEYVNIPVTLNYRTWKNLTIDQVNGATVGQAWGDLPTIKASKDYGLFSGILNRLPPEIRRVGRDVLQTIKRNLPIGKATGGRVFPPFTW